MIEYGLPVWCLYFPFHVYTKELASYMVTWLILGGPPKKLAADLSLQVFDFEISTRKSNLQPNFDPPPNPEF